MEEKLTENNNVIFETMDEFYEKNAKNLFRKRSQFIKNET